MSRAAYDRLLAEAGRWIAWAGGACPIDRCRRVTVLLENGETISGRAGDWSWARSPSFDGFEEPDEIVAYRR